MVAGIVLERVLEDIYGLKQKILLKIAVAETMQNSAIMLTFSA